MSEVTTVCQAPAKLNLFLHITGQRDDGYHLLQSVFVPIALYDELRFVPNERGVIKRANVIEGLSEHDDLVIKAAHALRDYVGRPELGVEIALFKAIPTGAGLGGGSSDAATTLMSLSQLWGLQLSREELLPIALSLGADVPFFLYAQPAIVEGVGEQINCLAPSLAARLSTVHYLLCVPKLLIPTVEIFRDERLNRASPSLPLEELDGLLAHMDKPWQYGHNDMEAVACRQHPRLALMCEFFAGLGIAVRMSGAGSVFFASFASAAEALDAQTRATKALSELAADHPIQSLALRTLVVPAHTI